MKLRALRLRRRRVALGLSDVEARRRVRPLSRAVIGVATKDAPAQLVTAGRMTTDRQGVRSERS